MHLTKLLRWQARCRTTTIHRTIAFHLPRTFRDKSANIISHRFVWKNDVPSHMNRNGDIDTPREDTAAFTCINDDGHHKLLVLSKLSRNSGYAAHRQIVHRDGNPSRFANNLRDPLDFLERSSVAPQYQSAGKGSRAAFNDRFEEANGCSGETSLPRGRRLSTLFFLGRGLASIGVAASVAIYSQQQLMVRVTSTYSQSMVNIQA